MKLTKRQAIYGAVFSLALAALAIDTVILRPDTVEAASDLPLIPAKPAAGAATPWSALAPQQSAVIRALDGAPLADRLRAVALAEGLTLGLPVPDAFMTSASWVESEVPEQALDTGDSAATQFRETHRLTGVFLSSQRAYAFVDGRAIYMGQAVDGFRLTSVTWDSATFVAGATCVILTTPKPAEQISQRFSESP